MKRVDENFSAPKPFVRISAFLKARFNALGHNHYVVRDQGRNVVTFYICVLRTLRNSVGSTGTYSAHVILKTHRRRPSLLTTYRFE